MNYYKEKSKLQEILREKFINNVQYLILGGF